MIDRIERALRLACGALAALAGAALLLMMIQTVIDVSMRNFAGRPIEGNLEIMSVYHMVALVSSEMKAVPIKDAIKSRKKVDPTNDKMITARDIGICFGD